MSSVYFDPDLSDEQRRQRLYAGDIIVLSATPGDEGSGVARLRDAGGGLRATRCARSTGT